MQRLRCSGRSLLHVIGLRSVVMILVTTSSDHTGVEWNMHMGGKKLIFERTAVKECLSADWTGGYTK